MNQAKKREVPFHREGQEHVGIGVQAGKGSLSSLLREHLDRTDGWQSRKLRIDEICLG